MVLNKETCIMASLNGKLEVHMWRICRGGGDDSYAIHCFPVSNFLEALMQD